MKMSSKKFLITAFALLSSLALPPSSFAGLAVTGVAAGAFHSLFIKSDGSLWGMGDNSYGQLGLGFTPLYTNLPVQILSSGVGAVAPGPEANHSLIRIGRDLWGMGLNTHGELGDGTTNNHYFPERVFPGGFSISASVAAAGVFHSLFATYSGTVVPNNGLRAMGANGAAELGDGTYTEHNTPEQVVLSIQISGVAAGAGHSLYIRSGGILWGMGDNQYGQLGLGTTNGTNVQVEIVSGGVTAVACGDGYSLFLKSDGSLWGMGLNYYGQLGDNSTSDKHFPEQLTANGVTAIACGAAHSLFIKSDGSLWGMGYNAYGQLGLGLAAPYYINVPARIVASNVVAVVAGGYHSLFVKSDGSLWGMGLNDSGQLGDGSFANHLTPFQIVAGLPPAPVITGISLSGANLNLSGLNGVSGETLYTLTATNATQPLNQWEPVATNQLNADGNFNITAINAVKPGAPQQFYTLQAQ